MEEEAVEVEEEAAEEGPKRKSCEERAEEKRL
jgi:hypothetical protein